MRRLALSAALAGILTALFVPVAARAQAPRTFVSAQGSDSNLCTLAAPCRSFAQALTQTNPGGEIIALDSAGYGVVTINKAVSISAASGVEAGIAAPSGQPAISVTAFGNFGATTVALRGLTLEGQGVATDGIAVTGTGRIEIVDCSIRNFTHDGINISTGSIGGGSNPNSVFISNTTTSDNGANGIEVNPQFVFEIRGVIDHVVANANGGSGILINGANTSSGAFVDIGISDAIADSNGADGLTVEGLGDVKVEIKNSTSTNNLGNGVSVSNARVGLSATSLVENNAGFAISNSGTLATFQDNIIENNHIANTGTATPVTKQ